MRSFCRVRQKLPGNHSLQTEKRDLQVSEQAAAARRVLVQIGRAQHNPPRSPGPAGSSLSSSAELHPGGIRNVCRYDRAGSVLAEARPVC